MKTSNETRGGLSACYCGNETNHADWCPCVEDAPIRVGDHMHDEDGRQVGVVTESMLSGHQTDGKIAASWREIVRLRRGLPDT
jgi:hypothetical protein